MVVARFIRLIFRDYQIGKVHPYLLSCRKISEKKLYPFDFVTTPNNLTCCDFCQVGMADDFKKNSTCRIFDYGIMDYRDDSNSSTGSEVASGLSMEVGEVEGGGVDTNSDSRQLVSFPYMQFERQQNTICSNGLTDSCSQGACCTASVLVQNVQQIDVNDRQHVPHCGAQQVLEAKKGTMTLVHDQQYQINDLEQTDCSTLLHQYSDAQSLHQTGKTTTEYSNLHQSQRLDLSWPSPTADPVSNPEARLVHSYLRQPPLIRNASFSGGLVGEESVSPISRVSPLNPNENNSGGLPQLSQELPPTTSHRKILSPSWSSPVLLPTMSNVSSIRDSRPRPYSKPFSMSASGVPPSAPSTIFPLSQPETLTMFDTKHHRYPELLEMYSLLASGVNIAELCPSGRGRAYSGGAESGFQRFGIGGSSGAPSTSLESLPGRQRSNSNIGECQSKIGAFGPYASKKRSPTAASGSSGFGSGTSCDGIDAAAGMALELAAAKSPRDYQNVYGDQRREDVRAKPYRQHTMSIASNSGVGMRRIGSGPGGGSICPYPSGAGTSGSKISGPKNMTSGAFMNYLRMASIGRSHTTELSFRNRCHSIAEEAGNPVIDNPDSEDLSKLENPPRQHSMSFSWSQLTRKPSGTTESNPPCEKQTGDLVEGQAFPVGDGDSAQFGTMPTSMMNMCSYQRSVMDYNSMCLVNENFRNSGQMISAAFSTSSSNSAAGGSSDLFDSGGSAETTSALQLIIDAVEALVSSSAVADQPSSDPSRQGSNPVEGSMPAEFNRIVELVDQLTLSDVGLNHEGISPAYRSKLRREPITYMEVVETPSFNLCIFVLNKKGAKIPLHNHPRMHGILKLLKGRVEVETFRIDPDRPCPGSDSEQLIICSEHFDKSIVTPRDPPGIITPNINIHCITALEERSIFFDVLMPCYDPPNRDCEYFEVVEVEGSTPGGGNFFDRHIHSMRRNRTEERRGNKSIAAICSINRNHVKLKKTGCPRYYSCDSIPYQGPALKWSL